jgi:hypothetical protein
MPIFMIIFLGPDNLGYSGVNTWTQFLREYRKTGRFRIGNPEKTLCPG